MAKPRKLKREILLSPRRLRQINQTLIEKKLIATNFTPGIFLLAGNIRVNLSPKLNPMLFFQVSEEEKELVRTIEFLDQFLKGLAETQAAKKKLSDEIDKAQKNGKNTVEISLKDYIPDFVKNEIKRYFGKKFLDQFLGLKPFVLDLKTCEAKSEGNKKVTLKNIKLQTDNLPGFLKFIVEKIFGTTIEVTFSESIKFMLDCKKLKKCTLKITDIDGIEIGGIIPDPKKLIIDTRKGTFTYHVPFPFPNVEIELDELLDKFKELIDDFQDAAEEEEDPKKKKRMKEDIKLLEKKLKGFKDKIKKLKEK